MNCIRRVLLPLGFSLLFPVLMARGGIVATNLFTLQSVPAGTNFSTGYLPGATLIISPVTLLFQNNGLPNTNCLTNLVQMSFDGTNWATVATYTPATTNAVVDSFIPNLNTNRVFVRVQNIVAVGAGTNLTVGVVAATGP